MSENTSLSQCDIEVEISLLAADDGGRATPVRSGYRPQFFYAGQHWDAVYSLIGTECLVPGQSARAYVAFTSPALHVGSVHAGMPFLIREGKRIVGFGSVLRLVDLANCAEAASKQSNTSAP